MINPVVSVVLPVCNGRPFVETAVASVLSQSFSELELIVIDDGSTDGTGEILRQLAAADTRVRLIQRENRGLVATLNEGLALSRGAYVARLDADDRYEPACLARQVAWLEQHPEVVLLGVTVFEHPWFKRFHRGVSGREMTRLSLLFGNPIGHPGVMLRRAVLEHAGLRYDPARFLVEDHDLWCRLALVGEVDILPHPLVFYRRHATALSSRHYAAQVKAQRHVIASYARQLADVALDDLVAAEDRTWCRVFGERMLGSRFALESAARQRLMHRLLQDHIARFGAGVARDYLGRWGLSGLLRGRWFGVWFLLRVAVRSLRRARATKT